MKTDLERMIEDLRQILKNKPGRPGQMDKRQTEKLEFALELAELYQKGESL